QVRLRRAQGLCDAGALGGAETAWAVHRTPLLLRERGCGRAVQAPERYGRRGARRGRTRPGAVTRQCGYGRRTAMSAEDLEKYETDMELQLYREYRDIVRQFAYVVETERRFYLANAVDLQVRNADGEVYFELRMSDAWVWDISRAARFVKNVRVVTFKDVNVEELEKPDLEVPEALTGYGVR